MTCHHRERDGAWDTDEKHRKMFENVDVPYPETFNDDYKGKSAAAPEATMRIDRDLTERDVKVKPPEGLTGMDLKKWKHQRYMRDYLPCLASINHNIRRVLESLEKNGPADN